MCKYVHLTLVLLSALGLTALFILIAPVQEAILASTQTAINVNTLEDEDNGDGDCSLREAIRAARENDPVDACPAGESVITDTITFSVTGMITLTDQLSVTAGGPLMIDGTEAITISGGGSVRLFFVETGARLTLENLILIDGYAGGGGAIYNHGNLTINNCSLSDNSTPPIGLGGGIFNWLDGNLTINRSFIANNNSDTGGGIYNNGTLRVYNSTLSNNNVEGMWGIGGGIYNENNGILAIDKSTLYGNSAYYSGAGIFSRGTLTITNSTLSGNSAGENGGGINNQGIALTVLNSTLSGNYADDYGGGIYSIDIVASFGGSILAYNPMGGNCAGDPIADVGYNLEDADTCGFSLAQGSLPNTDPLLGPLQDNGGPTWTHELLVESPAIDAGDPVICPTTDQRGVLRPIDGDNNGDPICDIGSYEFNQVIALEPASQLSSDVPGATLEYIINLVNYTNVTDTYTLALGFHAWETTLSTDTLGPLPGGESQSFTISVTIPVTATWYTSDTVIITAASVTSPTVFWDTAQVTTQVYAPAEISISPPALTSTLYVDQIVTLPLTISNGFGVPLTFSITPSGSAQLLSVEPNSGSVDTNSAEQVLVTLDAVGVPPGVYSATLIVESNDPDTPSIPIPVTVTVQEEPTPFWNIFLPVVSKTE